MKELKVGERITIECVESDDCEGCFFGNEYKQCFLDFTAMHCGSHRDDGEVKFIEIQVHTFTDEELKKHDKAISDASYANAIANAKVWITNLIVSAGMSIGKDNILKDFTRWMGETK